MKKLSLGLVLLLAAGAAFWWYQTRGLILDRSEVERIAARMLPGARPLPQCPGAVATDKGFAEVAVFAPSPPKAKPAALRDGELSITLARFKQPGDGGLERWLAQLSAAQEERKALRELEKGPELVTLGGRPQPAVRTVSQVEDRKLLEYATAVPVEGTVVLVQFAGLEKSFDRAGMDLFLSHLEPPGPAPGSGAAPQPEPPGSRAAAPGPPGAVPPAAGIPADAEPRPARPSLPRTPAAAPVGAPPRALPAGGPRPPFP